MTGYYAQQVRRDKRLPGVRSGGGQKQASKLGRPCLPALLRIRSAIGRTIQASGTLIDGN